MKQVENGTTNVYTLGMGNKLSSFGTSGSVQYDAGGNVTNAAYDGGRVLALTWDGAYRLTSASNTLAGVELYGYDAFDRRVWISDGAQTNHLVYAGPHVVAETDPAGGVTRSYTYGPGIDSILSMTVYSGGSTTTFWYVTDHLNTVWALVDAAGAVVESYDYDAFGNVSVYDGSGTPLTESAVGNRFLFHGRKYSWAAGLYYFRARWYDPVTGRWLSNDPIGISGGLNQYVFCANNPVNFVDPLGLVAWGTVWRGVAGAGVSVIGMVAGVAATPTGALTGPGAALAYVSAYSFGANVGNIINGFRDVPASPTGPVGTVATLVTDNRTVQTAANITDAVIPMIIAGRIEWSRLPTQPGGLPGTLAGTLERVPMNPSVAYPALRAFEYGYLGLQGYDYLIDPALDVLNDRYNDDPCK